MIRKVRQGERLSIRADDWNAIADTVNGAGERRTGAARTSGVGEGILVRNAENIVLPRYTAVRLSYPATMTEDEPDVLDVLRGSAGVSGERYALLETDLEPGEIGRARVSGMFRALSNAIPTSLQAGERCSPSTTGRMARTGTGPFEVMWAASSNQTIVVRFLGRGEVLDTGYFAVRTFLDGQTLKVEILDANAPFGVSAGPVRVGGQSVQVARASFSIGNGGVAYVQISYSSGVYSTYTAVCGFASSLPSDDPAVPSMFVGLADVSSSGTVVRRRPMGEIEVLGRWC